MPKGKSKSEMEKEVIIGCFPPCVCAKILFTSTEEKRVTPALLKVDLLNANVHLTFSCTFKEEPSECSYFTLQCLYINLVHVYSSMYLFPASVLYAVPTSPESLVSSGSSWVASAHHSPTHTIQTTAGKGKPSLLHTPTAIRTSANSSVCSPFLFTELSVLTPTPPGPSWSAATPPSSPQADVVLCKPAGRSSIML